MKQRYGEIAQLARACGSYPQCRGFKSPSRYEGKRTVRFPFLFSLQEKNMVKALINNEVYAYALKEDRKVARMIIDSVEDSIHFTNDK